MNILNEVKQFSRKSSWFRGHGNNDFELHSGLFRLDLKEIFNYIEAEVVLYRKFINIGHLHHNTSDWNLLYLMQHHGVITRLLDWSESFNVALFFAYKNWKFGELACVWMLHPTELNSLSTGKTQFLMPRETTSYEDFLFGKAHFNDYSVALYPVRNSNRVVAQQGVFTLQGNSLLPLDAEHGGALVNNGDLKKIVLTENLRDDVARYLEISGVNYYTLFPDLDGLAKEVNGTYSKLKKLPGVNI